MITWMCCAAALGWEERGLDGALTGRHLEPSAFFAPHSPKWKRHLVVTAPLDLGLVAAHTADTLRRLRATEDPLATAGLFGPLGVSLDDVLATLDLVARTAFEDRGRHRQRLQDPRWIAAHFQALQWIPDRQAAEGRGIPLTNDEIRLTKYVVYSVAGSRERTDEYNTALYAIPADELAEEEPPSSVDLIRMQLTRMDVYNGAFDEGGRFEGQAAPLVWLTRDGSNQALLQGTIEVTFEDGVRELFNVHRNNGLAWQPNQRDLDQQPRFWYFRKVQGILGVQGTALRPKAAVAGDVYNVGLGKLVALEWPTKRGPELRLVVLADTGGAFQPNLFQLDYLAGTFPSKDAYLAWAADTPARVPASILVRRP